MLTFCSRHRSRTNSNSNAVQTRSQAPFYQVGELNVPYSCNKRLIIISGQLERHAKIGDLEVKSTFLTADNPAHNVLVRNKFINQYILGILPNDLEVMPQSSQLMAFLSTPSKTVSNTVTTDELGISQVAACDDDVKGTGRIRLNPRWLFFSTVVSTARGVLPFDATVALRQHRLMPGNGITKVVPYI